MHRHEFQHVAVHLYLSHQERLHGFLRILVDKNCACRGVVGGERGVHFVEMTEVHNEFAAGRVHVAMHDTLAERHVGDDLVETHHHRYLRGLVAVLLTDRPRSVHPLRGEKEMGHDDSFAYEK